MLINLVLTTVYHAGDITCISWAPKMIPMGKLPSLCSIRELSVHFYDFPVLDPWMNSSINIFQEVLR